MRLVLRAFLGGLICVLALTGCGGHSGQRYQLQSTVAEPAPGQGPLVIMLGPIRLADYLYRERIIQRLDGDVLAVGEGRWAGSLQDDLSSLLLQELSAALQQQTMIRYPAQGVAEADLQLVLEVLQLDSGPKQQAVLKAQWRVIDAGGQLLGSRLVRLEQAHDGTLEGQVAAQSLLASRLGQQLVETLHPAVAEVTRQAQEPVAARQAPKPARRRDAATPAKTDSGRSDVNTFRF